MTRRFRLRQHLTIHDISDDGEGLRVSLSTPAGHRHWIRFFFDDHRALADQLATLRRWMHLGTPLTYLSAGAEGALIDDRALFESAFFDGVDR
jgi:hypothetical protein